MSETVWFEQVDTALIDFISNIVKIEDSDGVVRPVPVQVRKPDEDFKVEVYPSVTIYNLYSILDKDRIDDRYIRKSIDEKKFEVTLERTAIPYNLFYQIDFWAKYQTDMNAMTRLWIGNTGRDFNLSVKDMSGTDRSCFVLNTDKLVKSDFIDGTDRVFHSSMTYRVYVEVDENIQVVKPVVITTPNVTKLTN